MITGALIFFGGLLAGLVVRSLPRRRSAAPTPTCQCRHPRSQHDPESNKCHDQVHRSSTGQRTSRWEQCPCRQYVGPEPLPTFFSKGLER